MTYAATVLYYLRIYLLSCNNTSLETLSMPNINSSVHGIYTDTAEYGSPNQYTKIQKTRTIPETHIP
jgi:hypothetical protein